MMLLGQSHKAKAVGITCVGGNTKLDNVVMNNLRVLKLYNQLGKVPVYKGCSQPLVSIHPSQATENSSVHGEDGMGGHPDFFPEASLDLLDFVEEDHAVNGIIKLSKKYTGKLKIVATGPLTNIAMAVKLDPELPSRLVGIYIMGGTRFAQGNCTPAAEFNFCMDPEAVFITLDSFSHKCPIHLVNWEYTLENSLPWNYFDDLFSGDQNDRKKFAHMVTRPLDVFSRDTDRDCSGGMVLCDAYAMSIALDSSIGLKPKQIKVTIELGGHHARGHVVVDYCNKSDNFSTITVYDSFDFEKYHNLLKETFQ
ncbi:unnamed protein product [Clavelina lepadiformis]|uniref:Inosine/uridine-preferring nucleoside hydrolase domain-containing protein n=1 Tax=Clavelina lepadiformis TaxID=159417 RepID=A0ABP0FW69_CLALP